MEEVLTLWEYGVEVKGHMDLISYGKLIKKKLIFFNFLFVVCFVWIFLSCFDLLSVLLKKKFVVLVSQCTFWFMKFELFYCVICVNTTKLINICIWQGDATNHKWGIERQWFVIIWWSIYLVKEGCIWKNQGNFIYVVMYVFFNFCKFVFLSF